MEEPTTNPYASPSVEALIDSGLDPSDCWSDGDMMVLSEDSVVPERCGQCNGVSSGSIALKGYFPSSARTQPSRLLLPVVLGMSVVIGVVLQPLLELIGIQLQTPEVVTTAVLIAMAFVLLVRIRGEKSGARIRISLCKKHLRLFQFNQFWTGFCACLPFGFIGTIVFQRLQIITDVGIQTYFVMMLLTGIVWIGIAKIAFRPQLQHRIDRYVWLSGMDSELVHSLERFPHSVHIRSVEAVHNQEVDHHGG